MNESTAAEARAIPSVGGGGTGDYSYPWQPDCGDGTYRNPVIYADYSDPDVVRVGDDFYLTASSFNCTPGLPVLHSKDLVNWTLVGHALKNLPDARYDDVQPGCGIWAPAIRYHAGKYWIFYPTPDEGIFVTTAKEPAGPWSEPHCVQEGKGLIDPCPLWDDDGKAYLVHAYAGSRAGIKHRLRVCPMSPDGTGLLGEGNIVFHKPDEHPTLEGPKFLKKDGWYYILAPAGGVETGWQLALRSRSIYGPYEEKIVLAQRNTNVNGPHQGALVDTPAGDWWFMHFQDAGLYGRIVHLQPVEWHDGWPIMGNNGAPVPSYKKPVLVHDLKQGTLQTSDEFDQCQIGFQWQWHANHKDDWYSLAARPGWLRLYPQLAADSFNAQPNVLLQKFPARSFRVETMLEFFPRQAGEETGLAVVGERFARLGLRHDGAETWLVLGTDEEVVSRRKIVSGRIRLGVEVQDGGQFRFGFADEDEFIWIPKFFQATKGRWIGAKLGLYSIRRQSQQPSGYVDFAHFHFF